MDVLYILIVSRGYPTDQYKRNGIFEFDQAKSLAQAGCRVIFAVIDLRSIIRFRKFGRESLVKYGVQIEAINIPCGRAPRKVRHIIGELGFSKLFKDIVKKHGRPDIIHAHFTDCSFIAARLAYRENIPLVVTEHSSAMNKDTIDKYLYHTAEFAYKNASKVIAVGSTLAQKIEARFSVKALCIPNIVDTSAFQYKRQQCKQEFSIVSTGNLIPGKNMSHLIKAFHKAVSEGDNCTLYIFGEGPERGTLERLISELKLTNRIFLMGLCDREKIAEKMKESNYFILASQGETFGVAYIEALAMGLPVIATRCGGPEDFVTEDNGILVPIDDIDALVEAMKTMKKDIKNYDRKRISDVVKEKYSPMTIANRLIGIYKDVINR